jgi:hypothetical protein
MIRLQTHIFTIFGLRTFSNFQYHLKINLHFSNIKRMAAIRYYVQRAVLGSSGVQAINAIC